MIDEIRSFMEELRRPSGPPQNYASLPPGWYESLLADYQTHTRLMIESVDKIDDALTVIYNAGADDPVAVDVLDQVVAIIRKRGESPNERMRQIANLLKELGRMN